MIFNRGFNIAFLMRTLLSNVLMMAMVFCALATASAQNNPSIQQISDRLEHSSVQPSDTLFIQQNQRYKEAKANGDVAVESSLSEFQLLTKYGSLMKYKDCIS